MQQPDPVGYENSGMGGPRVRNIALELIEGGADFTVRAQYEFQGSSGDDIRTLILDFTRTPFKLKGFVGEGVRITELASYIPPTRRVYEISTAPGWSWDRVRFFLDLHWKARLATDGMLLMFPQMLPRIIGPGGSNAISVQPLLTFAGDLRSTRSEIGGIGWDNSVSTMPLTSGMIQALFVAPPIRSDFDLVTDREVIFSSRVSKLMSAAARKNLVSHIGESVERIGDILGPFAKIRHVVASSDEVEPLGRFSPGALLTGLALALESPQVSDKEMFKLTARVAHTIWGGGCKITGAFAREFEGGLVTATALITWPEFLAASGSERLLLSYEERSSLARIRDQFASWRGNPKPALSLAIGSAIALQFARSAEARAEFSRIIADWWGSQLTSQVLGKSLSELGVRLPETLDPANF